MVEEKLVYVTESGEVISYTNYLKSLVPSKKNQQRIAVNKKTLKGFMLPSKQYMIWKEENQQKFNDWNVELFNRNISLPIMRCKIKVLFYFPDDKDRDLDNKFLTIGDCLVAADIVPKDSFKIYNDVHMKGWVNRAKPRTEIYITILTPEDSEYNYDLTPKSYYDEQKKRKNTLRRIQRDRKNRSEKP